MVRLPRDYAGPLAGRDTRNGLALSHADVPHAVTLENFGNDRCESVAAPIALTAKVKLCSTHRTIGVCSQVRGCFLRPKCSGNLRKRRSVELRRLFGIADDRVDSSNVPASGTPVNSTHERKPRYAAGHCEKNFARNPRKMWRVVAIRSYSPPTKAKNEGTWE